MDHPSPVHSIPEAALRSRLPARLRFLLPALITLGLAVAAHGAPPSKAPVKPAAKPAAGSGPKVGPGVQINPGMPIAGDRKAFVIEGDDHLFMVAAPEGWVLDDTSGMGSRIRCVFYPKGQQWASAPTVMYVNPLHGYTAKTRTVSALIAEDVRQFMKRAPKGRVVDAGRQPTGGAGKEAIVRYFSEDGGPPHEAVAYVPEKDLVMLVVLSSRTPGGFQAALPAYKSLLSSYAWVGTNREFGR